MTPDSKACGSCAVRNNAMTRRDFVSLATMSAVSLALAACGGAGVDDDVTGPIPPGVGTFTVRPDAYPALATVGGTAKVKNSPPVALARTASGFMAFSLSCTHQGTTTVIQPDFTITCPNHGARFSASGAWVGGERTSSLRQLPVELDAAGVATITLG